MPAPPWPSPAIMMMHHSFWWAVMHYHAVGRDASLERAVMLRFTMPWAVMPSLILIRTSCHACPAMGPWCITHSEEAVMHYYAVGPWCITCSERAVMHYHAMGPWCITRSEWFTYHAMGCDAITHSDEKLWCITMLHAVMPSLVWWTSCHWSIDALP